jgi:glycosyltransferase involved in cell wall biosynthesis
LAVPTPIRFSFVIPFFDCARFLRRAVDSALAQAGEDYELLLVDDGSRDDYPAALGPLLQHPRLRLLRQDNAGVSAARNQGAAAARGEYIWFLDCDDALLPDALAQVRQALEADPAAEMLVGGHVNLAPDGRERVQPVGTLGEDRRANFLAFIRRRLGSFTPGAVVLRREILQRLRFPVGISNNEDLVLMAQVTALHRCRSLPVPLLRKTMRPDSQRRNLDGILATGTRMVDALFDPAILPAELLGYRDEFLAGRRLSIFRSLYLHGRFAEAARLYRRTVRDYPAAALKWAYLSKYLRTLLAPRA